MKALKIAKSQKAWFDKSSTGCASVEICTIANVEVFVVLYFGKRAHSVRRAIYLSVEEAVAALENAGYSLKAIA